MHTFNVDNTKNITKIKYKNKYTIQQTTQNTDPSIYLGRPTQEDISNNLYTNLQNHKKYNHINFHLQPIKLQSNPYQEQPKKSPNKYNKVNIIRNNNNLTKQEITAIKARINKLRQQNQKNKRKTINNYDNIDKLLTTKYHSLQRQRYRSSYLQRKKSQQGQIYQKVMLAKITLHHNLQQAKQKNFEQKKINANRVKSTISQQQNLIKQQQQRNLFINLSKAQQIKLYQLQHRSKMNMYGQRSRIRARSNHQTKMQQYIKQRQLLQKTKRRLKIQQSKLVQQWKKNTIDLKQIEEKVFQIRNYSANRSNSMNNQRIQVVTKFDNYQ